MITISQPTGQTWADRLYADVPALPRSGPSVENALDAYRQVQRRFGSSARTRMGFGDCLMRLGLYGQAARAYGDSPLVEFARRRVEIAEGCQRWADGRRVLQVEPVPGRPRR